MFTTKCVFWLITPCLQAKSYQWRYVGFLKTWIFNTDIRIDRLAGRSEENIGKYSEGGSWTAGRRWKGGGSVWLLSVQIIWICVWFAGLILVSINMFIRSNSYIKQWNSLVLARLVQSTCFISLELARSEECYHFWIGVMNVTWFFVLLCNLFPLTISVFVFACVL